MQKDELLVTASLARLELEEKEIEKLDRAVTGMIEYFSVMDSIDVDDLEPTTHAFVKENRTREDAPSKGDVSDKMVENAPESDGRFIVIPNVL